MNTKMNTMEESDRIVSFHPMVSVIYIQPLGDFHQAEDVGDLWWSPQEMRVFKKIYKYEKKLRAMNLSTESDASSDSDSESYNNTSKNSDSIDFTCN